MDAPNPGRQASHPSRRLAWWIAGLAFLAGVVYLMATATISDPTEVPAREDLNRTTAVVNSAVIVFREGLEAVLIFAAVTASFLGANRSKQRPVVMGAIAAFGAAVVTWFGAQAVLDAFSSLGARLEAITGLVAILVLLVILNWFVHKIYWSEWIAKHHRQRRKLLAASGIGATVGLVALGFTSVYREGFEVVLFLQALDLRAGGTVVLEGVAIGLAATALVGYATFKLQRKLPYKKMLVLTGVLIGGVLVVMVGGTALSFQDLGWLPSTPLGVELPTWLGTWFEIYPTVETIAAQVLAALFVIGSYYLAKEMKVWRPVRRGEQAARVAEVPPALEPQPAAASASA